MFSVCVCVHAHLGTLKSRELGEDAGQCLVGHLVTQVPAEHPEVVCKTRNTT